MTKRRYSRNSYVHRQRDRWSEPGYYPFVPAERTYGWDEHSDPRNHEYFWEFEPRGEGELEHRAEEGPHRGKGPKNWTRSDVRMLEDISERLFEDSWIDAADLEVKVEQGEVTLTGKIDTLANKRRVEDLAYSVAGVIEVHNRLEIEKNPNTKNL